MVLMPTVYLWGAQEEVLKQSVNSDTEDESESNDKRTIAPGNSINSRESFSSSKMPVLSLEDNTDQYIDFKDIEMYGKEVYVPVSKKSFFNQLRSYEFCFIILFASMQMLKANTYMGSVVDLLNSYGDKHTGHLYSKIFGFVLPAGIVCVPFIDYSINRLGLTGSLHMTNMLGLIFSAIALYPVLEYQIATFCSSQFSEHFYTR